MRPIDCECREGIGLVAAHEKERGRAGVLR